MNPSQIHLAFTHIPVILSIVGLIMLIVSLIIRNDVVTKTSYCILLFAGLSATPVFFTGEGAEEVAEKLPGVSENIIGKHEVIANLALAATLSGAALSLVGLLFYKKAFSKALKIIILVVAFVTGGFMFQTAHLGGQIRHTEVRSGFTSQNNRLDNSNAEKKELTKEDKY